MAVMAVMAAREKEIEISGLVVVSAAMPAAMPAMPGENR
jgi:hypothetical protein